jgi:hypothetical protein
MKVIINAYSIRTVNCERIVQHFFSANYVLWLGIRGYTEA